MSRIDLCDEMKAFAGIHAETYDTLARIGSKMTEARYGFGGGITPDEADVLFRFAQYVQTTAALARSGIGTTKEKADEVSALPDYPLPVERLYE